MNIFKDKAFSNPIVKMLYCKDTSSHKPLLYFEVYDTYLMYNPPKNLLIQDIEITPKLSYEEYCAAISYIKMRLLESEQAAKTNIASAKYYPHHPPKNKAIL